MTWFATVDPRPIHFMGIAGAGMSGLALLARQQGAAITGCDNDPSGAADLAALGVEIWRGHDPGHLASARALVVTAAVAGDHPELERARALGIPVVRRADALGQAVAGGIVVAVAGTHGKTTTTVMVTEALAAAGRNPTGLAGGRVAWGGGNARLGGRDLYVVEADEFDRAFLALAPTVAVVNNVEADHLECYGGSTRARAGVRGVRVAGAPRDRGRGRRGGAARGGGCLGSGVASRSRGRRGRAHRRSRAAGARLERTAGAPGRSCGAGVAPSAGAAQPAERGGGDRRGPGAGSRSRALRHGARTLYRRGAAVRAGRGGARGDGGGRLRASPHGGAGHAGGGAPGVPASAGGGGVPAAPVLAHRAARRSVGARARDRGRGGGRADLCGARAAGAGRHRRSRGAGRGAGGSDDRGGAGPRRAGGARGGAGAAGGRGVHAGRGRRHPRRPGVAAAAPAGGRGKGE